MGPYKHHQSPYHSWYQSWHRPQVSAPTTLCHCCFVSKYQSFETVMPCFQALPQFLMDTKFANPSDGTNTAFQRAHHTDLPPFVWALEHPFNYSAFNQFMTAQREGQPIWLDVFPFEKLLAQDVNPETPLFVDVGGGVGHQCAALKARFPQVPGRVILQDQAQILPQALPTPGVEAMGHDFWTPQPVKGSRCPILSFFAEGHFADW